MDLVDDAAQGLRPATDDGAAADEAPAPVLGEFRIIREIGRGGMGVVYEAEQRPLGRRVALKVLPSAASTDPRRRQRFQLEAQAAARLHHEHIVPVFGIGIVRGTHYDAMQLIEGRPLTQVVRELAAADRAAAPADAEADGSGPAAGRAQPPKSKSQGHSHSSSRAHARETVRLGLQAAEALEHAHAMGVVHRDVKPANS
ncbi:protein kinase [Paludisphaera sp. Pla2]|uniref:Protein kinase n=1 Tax=Paludisphaera mucosa TaxID=3030827 RepID=A0ABT6FBT2_9BACT|nr:protein kinase [Paludisphaera mucosa]MDG3004840.1 protein kinase [Paludisphaera mucosa]